ncbi:MAG: DUF4910 domain-containing protein [Bacteroidota bacterium]
MPHYTYDELVNALRKVGLKAGDTVFTHSNIGAFGFSDRGSSENEIFNSFLEAFLEVLGSGGTLIVPSFTYSYGRMQVFDPETSISQMGIFAERLRKKSGVFRSEDPMFSVVAFGKNAEFLTSNVSNECFGDDSFWDRFYKINGVICNLGIFGGISTFIHYVEKKLKVPYRYDKFYPGMVSIKGVTYAKNVVFFCADMMNSETQVYIDEFNRIGLEQGIIKTQKLGRGVVSLISAQDTFTFIKETIKKYPNFLIQGAKIGKDPVLLKRNTPFPDKRLTSNANMEEMIKAVWDLPRDLVSDGYDDALNILSSQIDIKIHEYPTGSRCWTWIVPEKWTCTEASLESIDGKKIFSYDDNFLHVAAYSQSFNGVVSREHLFNHLTTHEYIGDAIPFDYLFYKRDWKLCCSKTTKDSLTDPEYKVKIKSEFSYGTLKVGEIFIKGETDECIVLCGHLDHANQVNDGLSGVVVGIEVMRRLKKLPQMRYSYRLIICPESIGSVAYLSNNEDLIPNMKGGIFLEMLGLKNSHTLQFSKQGNTQFDICCKIIMAELEPNCKVGKFLQVVTNDDRQFNAPGIDVPMLSLSRVEKPTGLDGAWLYPEYHSNLDNPALCSIDQLNDSVDKVIGIIKAWENNYIPVNKFKGEIFLSGCNITYDFASDPKSGQALFEVMHMIDGKSSLIDIADATSLPFSSVLGIVNKFHEKGLVEKKY